MKTIIFVCHGSICRSPAAAFIAKQYLKETNREKEFNILIRATSSEELENDKGIIYRINKFTPSIYEIEDPWYTGRYEKVCDEITDCIHDIFNNL